MTSLLWHFGSKTAAVQNFLGLRKCASLMEEKWAAKGKVFGEMSCLMFDLSFGAKILAFALATATFKPDEGRWLMRPLMQQQAQAAVWTYFALPAFAVCCYRTHRSVKNKTLCIPSAPWTTVLF